MRKFSKKLNQPHSAHRIRSLAPAKVVDGFDPNQAENCSPGFQGSKIIVPRPEDDIKHRMVHQDVSEVPADLSLARIHHGNLA